MAEIYKCDCGCGGVEISTWEEEGDVIYIEFLKRCRAGRSLKQRLKMIWRLLRWGYYYDDDIVLTKVTAGALGTALVEMSNKIKEQ